MSWDSFPILPYCYNRCVGIHEAWYLASAPGRCHCICRPYDWNDVASVLPQVAFHYHRKTGIHYIHLWTSPLSFTLSLLPARWSHSWLELFQTLKPNPQKLTRPRYLPANPNPYRPASPISWVTSMAFCLWQFVRWLQFPTIDKMWFSINMVLILIFSICPYALSRSEDSSFGISSCLSSSAFAISLASSALDGAADICSYALFQADSNITISFNN